MSIVLELLRLALIFATFLALLFGQGWLVAGFLLHGSLVKRRPAGGLLQEAPLVLLCGLMLNYLVLLAVHSLPASLVVSGILTVLGISLFVLGLVRGRRELKKPVREAVLRWVGAGLVSLLLLGPILAEPLRDWDARSIWFFQARMLYLAGTLGPSAGWQTAGMDWAHFDYPKLLAGLAAQVAQVSGFWNEYLPKLALYFLLLPVILWAVDFVRRSFSSILLVGLLLLGFFPNIWNGYMDGLLATYFCLSMLFFGRYFVNSQRGDLFASLACLFLLADLKNEGTLALLAGCAAILLMGFFKWRRSSVKSILRGNWKTGLALAVLILPVLVWTFYKGQWGLVNDLQLGSGGTVARLGARLADGSWFTILQLALAQLERTGLLVVLLGLAWLVLRGEEIREALPAIVAGGLYGAGILLVYLVTPMDLTWHLISSIDRTMLAVNGCLYIVAYWLLLKIETAP